MLNKTVEIKKYGQDTYGRALGVVFLSGKNVNMEMVKARYGKVFRGASGAILDNAPYFKTEGEAKAAKREMCVKGR